MYCQSCGKQLRNEARFCHECGAVVTVSQDSSKQKTEQTHVRQSPGQDMLQFYHQQQENSVVGQQELGYSCPFCNADIKRSQNKCPSCQEKIDWELAEIIFANNQTDLTSSQYGDNETKIPAAIPSTQPVVLPTSDILLRKRQEIYELQNKVKMVRSNGKSKMIQGVLYLLFDIFFFVLCIMSPTSWYYWAILIIGIIFDFWIFSKGNRLLNIAHEGEEIISELEKELQVFESKGGM